MNEQGNILIIDDNKSDAEEFGPVLKSDMQLAGGDQSKAAQWLGIARPAMREELVRDSLHPRIASTAGSFA